MGTSLRPRPYWPRNSKNYRQQSGHCATSGWKPRREKSNSVIAIIGWVLLIVLGDTYTVTPLGDVSGGENGGYFYEGNEEKDDTQQQFGNGRRSMLEEVIGA